MSEKVAHAPLEQIDYHNYRDRVHAYFFSQPGAEEERDYYESRDLTFTNNLHLWFIDNPGQEVIPGFPDPYDYRRRSFGVILDEFRLAYPQLWQDVQQTMYEKRLDNAAYIALLQQENLTPEILEEYEQRQKDYSASLKERAAIAKSRAFDILAPQLAKANIDPLDICR